MPIGERMENGESGLLRTILVMYRLEVGVVSPRHVPPGYRQSTDGIPKRAGILAEGMKEVATDDESGKPQANLGELWRG